MSLNYGSDSRSHANRIGRSESSKVFEIEQCMYNLSEDFTRQTDLRVPAEPAEEHVKPEVCSQAESDGAAPPVPTVHTLADILRCPIPDEIMRKLCFSEMMLVCDGNETIIGGAAINVSLIAQDVLAAFSSTRLTFLGRATAESELMSFADRSCRPLQERKCETLISGTTRQEKQIQLYFDETNRVTAYRQECDGLRTESFQGMLDVAQTGSGSEASGTTSEQTILPDGLQLLLLRYLIVSNFVGEICSQTIDIQGRVGNCVHRVSAAMPASHGTRRHRTSETVKEVRKTIWYPDGSEPEESVSHYSSTGRLLRHGWNGSNYVLIANPLGSAPPSAVVDLERSMKDYVQALAGLIRNRSSVKGLIDDVHCSVKEMDISNRIVNPVLLDIIKELDCME